MTIQAPRTMQLGGQRQSKRYKPYTWRRHRSDTSLRILKRHQRTEKIVEEKKVGEVKARVVEDELVKQRNGGTERKSAACLRFMRAHGKPAVYSEVSTTNYRRFRRRRSMSSSSSALAAESMSSLHSRSTEASPLAEEEAPAPESEVVCPKTVEGDRHRLESRELVAGSGARHEDLSCSSSGSSVKSEKDPAKYMKDYMELQELLDECVVSMEELPDITQSEIQNLRPVDLTCFDDMIEDWHESADLDQSKEYSSSWGWPHFTTPGPGIFTCAGCTDTRLSSASGASLSCLPLPAKTGGLGEPNPDLCCLTWSSPGCFMSVRVAPSSGCGGVSAREQRRKALLERCARTIHQNYPDITLDKLSMLKQLFQESGVPTAALATLAKNSVTPSPGCFRGSNAVTSTATHVDCDFRGTPLSDSDVSDVPCSGSSGMWNTAPEEEQIGACVDGGRGLQRPGATPASGSATEARSSPLPSSFCVPTTDLPSPAQFSKSNYDHQYCRPHPYPSPRRDDSASSILSPCEDRLRLCSTDSAFFSDSAVGSESEDEHGFGRRGSFGYCVVDRHGDSDAQARRTARADQWAEAVKKDRGTDSMYGSDDESYALNTENYMSEDDYGNYRNKMLDDDKDVLDQDAIMWDDSGYVAKKSKYHKMGFLSDSEDDSDDEGPLGEQTMHEPSRKWVFDLEWSQNHHGSVLVL